MKASNDPTIQYILDSAQQLTREQRELQIRLETEKFSADAEYRAVLEGAFGISDLSAVSDDDFNHAAFVSWKFINTLHRSKARINY
ncbi:MAG: hypothetical protein ABJQ21_00200 [Roseibium sp.]